MLSVFQMDWTMRQPINKHQQQEEPHAELPLKPRAESNEHATANARGNLDEPVGDHILHLACRIASS